MSMFGEYWTSCYIVHHDRRHLSGKSREPTEFVTCPRLSADKSRQVHHKHGPGAPGAAAIGKNGVSIDGVVLSETRLDVHPPPRRLREIVLSGATGTRGVSVGVGVKELTGWNAERVS